MKDRVLVQIQSQSRIKIGTMQEFSLAVWSNNGRERARQPARRIYAALCSLRSEVEDRARNAIMERYGSNYLDDHSLHSFIETSGTYTERKGFSSLVGAALNTEEQDSDNECSDIGAARSPHHLTIPMRTFRHCNNERHNFNTSESSRNLLSGLDSHIDAPNKHSGGLNTTETRSVQSPKGKPNFLRRLPWMVLLSFLGNLTCTALSVYILVVSDQTTQDSWSVQPSVYLAVLAPLGNILLRYCLSEGLVNDWWNLASRGTTVEALHNRWEHGTSIMSAATSIATVDKIAAAKILFAATFAVNPLLQRASLPYTTVTVANVTVPFQLATTQSSFKDVGFRSVSLSPLADTGQLSTPMVRAMRDYTNRSPIINQFGECPGNCTGTVRAAGFYSSCARSHDETYRIDHSRSSDTYDLGQVVFETDILLGDCSRAPVVTDPLALYTFSVQTNFGNDSNDTSLPATSRSCSGVLTTVVCNLTHAVLEYPIVLRDNVITVDARPSVVRGLHMESDGNAQNLTDLKLGFNFAVKGMIQSQVTMAATEDVDGWNYQSTSPFPDFYMKNQETSNNITCAINSTDPTDDILTTFNEIMFRISLAAMSDSWNRSLAIDYQMTAQKPVPLYQSRYRYLAVATAISLLACCSVLPTFDGYWRLDRSYSLSPIEIARAFDAPLLRSSGMDTSHLPVNKLVKHVGTTQAQYVTVTDTDGEDMKLREGKFTIAEVA